MKIVLPFWIDAVRKNLKGGPKANLMNPLTISKQTKKLQNWTHSTYAANCCCSSMSSVGGLKTFKVHLTKHRKRGSALAKLRCLNGWPFVFAQRYGVIHYKNWSEKNICSEKSASEKLPKNARLIIALTRFWNLHNTGRLLFSVKFPVWCHCMEICLGPRCLCYRRRTMSVFHLFWFK